MVEVNYEQDSGCLLPKGKERNVEEIVNIPEYVNSPIQGGDKIGEVRYMLDGEQIGYTNLIAANTVKKINLSNMFETVFFSWFRVLR